MGSFSSREALVHAKRLALFSLSRPTSAFRRLCSARSALAPPLDPLQAADRLTSAARSTSASPPDVRRGYASPSNLPSEMGSAPRAAFGLSMRAKPHFITNRAARHSLASHPAAEPRDRSARRLAVENGSSSGAEADLAEVRRLAVESGSSSGAEVDRAAESRVDLGKSWTRKC